ncbi:universal stress protein [Iodidimonas muriae]|uniref:Universal stress protein n=1 Tax=Iodidimonas muriae TaxID=261467 RepID=A0ABQ2L8V8_9PROT|nr:universal stress protein [Iodidimonas muriae]GER05830.1 universal stress protein [Kordiimonadales bacterium JCM 17843]GGO07051.1 universal stress protein [Iodidimonas muriae]
MSKTYLYIVGVDGSECSRRAVEFAAKHAAHSGGHILLANIVHWSGFTPLSVEEAMRRPVDKKEEERLAKETVLAPLVELAKSLGVTDVDSYYSWGNPARELKKLAKERQAEMIIVGRRGHSSFADLVLGSVANSVAHIAETPVVLVP